MSDKKEDFGAPNPILGMMSQENIDMDNDNLMGSNITEQEIQKHKNKLNNLVYRLNNTHNIDEENSINNEIKNESEFLSSLLNIKRKELNPNNNMINKSNNNNINSINNLNNINNNFMNPLFNLNGINNINNAFNNNIMNNNQMHNILQQQQQMMQQQQIMQQNLIRQQQQQMIQQLELMKKMSMPLMTDRKTIEIIILKVNKNSNSKEIKLQCKLDDKVSAIIEKYRKLSGDKDTNVNFVFNGKNLDGNFTLEKAGIIDKCYIFVYKKI